MRNDESVKFVPQYCHLLVKIDYGEAVLYLVSPVTRVIHVTLNLHYTHFLGSHLWKLTFLSRLHGVVSEMYNCKLYGVLAKNYLPLSVWCPPHHHLRRALCEILNICDTSPHSKMLWCSSMKTILKITNNKIQMFVIDNMC